MPKSITSRRARFSAGEQRKYLKELLAIHSVSELARFCSCSERTIRDWRREKFTIPVLALNTLAAKTGCSLPDTYQEYDAYEHASSAGRKGYTAAVKRYGAIPRDEELRLKNWRKWWKTKGKYARQTVVTAREDFKTPRKSVELAEFIGIAMGDGGMTNYQVKISLNTVADAEYIHYVSTLMRILFDLHPAVYTDKKKCVTDIVISRSRLVHFLHGLGLPIGNKMRQGLDIPQWIKKNPRYAIACVRGLVDTDGCIFTHRYKVKSRCYAYKKLSFTSTSPALIESVYDLLSARGLHPRIGPQRDIRLDSIADMRRYFKLIGTSNPKHLKRYTS